MIDILNLDGTSYFDLINCMGVLLLTFRAVAQQSLDKFVCVRHDIDSLDALNACMDFAEFEYAHGWHTSYYVLYHSKYFNDSLHKDLIPICKKIQEMGHEIALHVSIMDLYAENPRNIKEILAWPLRILRKNGINISGVSAHGDPTCYSMGFNYELWKECNPFKNQCIGLFPDVHKALLKDLDLIYEAYLMDHSHYIMDSSGEWTGWIRDDRPLPYETFMIQSPYKRTKDEVISHFKSRDKGFLHLLVHPGDRWRKYA